MPNPWDYKYFLLRNYLTQNSLIVIGNYELFHMLRENNSAVEWMRGGGGSVVWTVKSGNDDNMGVQSYVTVCILISDSEIPVSATVISNSFTHRIGRSTPK